MTRLCLCFFARYGPDSPFHYKMHKLLSEHTKRDGITCWCLRQLARRLLVPCLSHNLNASPGSSATLVYYLKDIPQAQASYICHVAPIFCHFPLSEVNRYPRRPCWSTGSHLRLAPSDLENLKARHLSGSSPLCRQCHAAARVSGPAIALHFAISALRWICYRGATRSSSFNQ